LGCLTIHEADTIGLHARIQRIRRRTSRPVLAAFTAPFERSVVVDAAFAAGIRHFQVFWWNGPHLAPQIRSLGGTVFWQVGTVDQVQDAHHTGADVYIAPGRDAGGQVRTPHSIPELIATIRTVAGPEATIVAGGGLSTRADVAQVLAEGATAALLGTRFLLSEEARAPERDKARLLRADADDLALDLRIIGDWPCVPRRRLLTATGADRPSLFAGKGIDHMGRIPSAAQIVRELAPVSRPPLIR